MRITLNSQRPAWLCLLGSGIKNIRSAKWLFKQWKFVEKSGHILYPANLLYVLFNTSYLAPLIFSCGQSPEISNMMKPLSNSELWDHENEKWQIWFNLFWHSFSGHHGFLKWSCVYFENNCCTLSVQFFIMLPALWLLKSGPSMYLRACMLRN